MMRRALPPGMKHLVARGASPESRKLVLKLLAQNAPVTIQELYQQTVDYQEENLKTEGPSSEPDQGYVIPSMRYLKKVVLPELQSTGEVEKIHTKRTLSAEEEANTRQLLARGMKIAPYALRSWNWYWQLKAPVPNAPPKPEKKSFGEEVGVGEDWSHLNKRRQRARQEKVERDVQWMRELAKARTDASQ